MMGEAKINPGTGILFNMTPSPGASSCLENAEIDMKWVTNFIGKTVNQEKVDNLLHKQHKQ